MSRANGELTTTSYAILGLLAIKPWSTYELAQQMDRTLGRMWPRAQSKIYEEPKKLVARGLARAKVESTGRRPRTVYAITAKGRRAMRAWLGEPGAAPSLEYEQLLKVFFADQGSTAELVAQLERARAWSEEQRMVHEGVTRSYLSGEGRFPERAAILALTSRFLIEFAELVGAWAEFALDVVREWPADPKDAEVDWRLYEETLKSEAGGGKREAADSRRQSKSLVVGRRGRGAEV